MERCQSPSRLAYVAVIVGLTFAAGTTRSRATDGSPPVLRPRTYRSASGQFAVYVEPSNRLGRGGASYRLTKMGKEVWSGKKAFTLWDACVTDEGVVAGYSYSQGRRGLGDFRIVILDATGRVRMERVTKREPSTGLHMPPNPRGVGMILNGANDRMLVRLADLSDDPGAEIWHAYRLSNGELLTTLQPRGAMNDLGPELGVIDAKPVAGTPLFLIHWLRSEREDSTQRTPRVRPSFKFSLAFEASPL